MRLKSESEEIREVLGRESEKIAEAFTKFQEAGKEFETTKNANAKLERDQKIMQKELITCKIQLKYEYKITFLFF